MLDDDDLFFDPKEENPNFQYDDTDDHDLFFDPKKEEKPKTSQEFREDIKSYAQFALAMKGSVDAMSNALGFWWRLTPATWFPSLVAGALQGAQEELIPIKPETKKTENEQKDISSEQENTPTPEELAQELDSILNTIPEEDLKAEEEEVEAHYWKGWNRAKQFVTECAEKQWKNIMDSRMDYEVNDEQAFEDRQKMGIFSKTLAFEAKQALSSIAAENSLAALYCYAADALGVGGAIVSGVTSGAAHATGRWTTRAGIKTARTAASWTNYISDWLSGDNHRPDKEVEGYFSSLASSMVPYLALSILTAKALEEHYNKSYVSPSIIFKAMMEGFFAELGLSNDEMIKKLDDVENETEILVKNRLNAPHQIDPAALEHEDIYVRGIDAAIATTKMIYECNMDEIKALAGRKETIPTTAVHKTKKFISPADEGIIDTYTAFTETTCPAPPKINKELPDLLLSTPITQKSKPGETNLLYTVQDGITSTDYLKLEIQNPQPGEHGYNVNIKINPEIRAELVKLVAQNAVTEYMFSNIQTIDACSKGAEGGIKEAAYAAGRHAAKNLLEIVAPIPEVTPSKERG